MKTLLVLGLAAGLLIAGCSAGENRSTGVYVLFNTAEARPRNPNDVQQAIDYLLLRLAPADTLAAANIGTDSFCEKDIIARINFDQRPSVVTVQKRAFRERFARLAQNPAGSRVADISGGMLEAIEYLNQAGPERKAILIFSNLREKSTGGAARDIPFQMAGFKVVALNPKGLPPNSRDMQQYMRRAENLREKVEGGNGRFHIIEDLDQLEGILKQDTEIDGT